MHCLRFKARKCNSKIFLLVLAPTARAPQQARAARTLSLTSPRGLDWSPFWPPLPLPRPSLGHRLFPVGGYRAALCSCLATDRLRFVPNWSTVDHRMRSFESPLPTISSLPWSSTMPRWHPQKQHDPGSYSARGARRGVTSRRRPRGGQRAGPDGGRRRAGAMSEGNAAFF